MYYGRYPLQTLPSAVVSMALFHSSYTSKVYVKILCISLSVFQCIKQLELVSEIRALESIAQSNSQTQFQTRYV